MSDKTKVDWNLRKRCLSENISAEDLNEIKKTDPDYYKNHVKPMIDAGDTIITTNQNAQSTLTNVVDQVIVPKDTKTPVVKKSPIVSTPPPTPTPTPPPPVDKPTSINYGPYYPEAKPNPQPAPTPEPNKPILDLPTKELFAGETDIIKKLAKSNTITTDELNKLKKLSPKTYQKVTEYIKYFNQQVKIINSKYPDSQTKTAINSATTGALTPQDLEGLSDQTKEKIINLQTADEISKQTANEAESKKVQTTIEAASLLIPGGYPTIKAFEWEHKKVMDAAKAEQEEIKPNFPEKLTPYQLAIKLQSEKQPLPPDLLSQLSTKEIEFLQGQYNTDREIQHIKNIQAETLDLTEGGLVATETVLPLVGGYVLPKVLKNFTRKQAIKLTENKLPPSITENSTHNSLKNIETNLAPTKKTIPETTNTEIENISNLSISEMTPNQLQQHEKEIAELVKQSKTLSNPKDKWITEHWQKKLSEIQIHSQTLNQGELANAPKMKPWELMKKGFSGDFKVTEISNKRFVVDLKTGQIVGSCPKEEFDNYIFGPFGKYSLKQETIDNIPWQTIRNAEGKIISREKIEVLKQHNANDIIKYALNPSQYKIFDRKLTNGTIYRFVENRQTHELTKSYILNDSGQLNFNLSKTGSPDKLWKKSKNIFAYGQEWRVQKNLLNQILEITPDNKITSLAKIGSSFSHQEKLSQAINFLKKHESSIIAYFPHITPQNAALTLKSNCLKLQQIEKFIPESLLEYLKKRDFKIVIGDEHPDILRQPTTYNKIKKTISSDPYSGAYYYNDKTAYCGTKIFSRFEKTAPHEIGHAFDFLSHQRIGISREMKDIHIELYDKLRPYISIYQGIPGSEKGQQELFADAFADYFVFIKENGVKTGKKSFILKYNKELYNYLDNILAPYLKQ